MMDPPETGHVSGVASALRGACGRCPNCGRGKLFRGYLKPVDACSSCGEALGHIRADDGPSWLTIVLTGHIVVFAALAAETGDGPMWLPMLLWSSLALVLALSILPCAKGVFIGALWATKAEGSQLE